MQQSEIPSLEMPLGEEANLLAEIDVKESPTRSFFATGGAQGSAQALPSSSLSRVRRRNRVITSCLECRRRKLKCDKSHPCINCTRAHRDCVYLAPALDQASQLRLTQIKEKASSLELELETDVARGSGSAASGTGEKTSSDLGRRASHVQDGESYLPSPFVSIDAVYEDNADDDDRLDLGYKIGRMRITDRIGGFSRPKVADELKFALLMQDRQPSTATSERSRSSTTLDARAMPHLLPGPAYIAPTAGFFFGQTTYVSGLLEKLPHRPVTDRLIQAYFIAVYPVAKIIHKPTFEIEYESFWSSVHQNMEPPASVQAIVFSAIFSGLVSMDEETVLNTWGIHKDNFVKDLKIGTESALCRANFLKTTKLETLQAFVMYLIPLCRGEVSRTHSVLVGAAVRLAECIGLHRDGTVYGMNALETHIRRLIWHQLCWLDIRTCEAQGPKPGIRKDDFDTLLPTNIDDVDVRIDEVLPVDRDRWTDTTFVRMRFDINEFMRFIWIERPKLQRGEASLTSILTKIEKFHMLMNAKYDRHFDDRIPIQKHAKLVKCLLLSRLHVMVLAPYHTGAAKIMPPNLRKVLIGQAVCLLECAIKIETLPELHPWAFWAGSYQQSHAAFLLLIDLVMLPQSSINVDIDRIWNCLDYIFESDPDEPRETKGRRILREIQHKAKDYQQLRKVRAPISMVDDHQEHSRLRMDCSADGKADQAPLFRRESDVSDAGVGAIGKAPIPNLFLESPPSEGAYPVSTQQAYGLRVDGPGNIGVFPLASHLPSQRERSFSMRDIDWDGFGQLYPGNRDFSAHQHGFKLVNSSQGQGQGREI